MGGMKQRIAKGSGHILIEITCLWHLLEVKRLQATLRNRSYK